MLRPLGLAMLFAAAHSAWAQYVVSARAGTINFITGQVSVDDKALESGVERATGRGQRGQAVSRKSIKLPTLKDGQLLRTDDGRAEVLLGPGVFLRLGPHAALRMVNSRLTDTQVKIEHGTALVEVIEIANGSNVHVFLGDSRTSFRGIGLHRFDADSGNLSVFGGHADVTTGAQTFDAARGRAVHLLDIPIETRFDPREKDPLLQWAAARSFRLYITNPAARARLTNWEVTNASARGSDVASDQTRSYYFNRDFGVQFISRVMTASPLSRPIMPPSMGDLYPREDPATKPPTNSNIPTVTFPGPASQGTFPY